MSFFSTRAVPLSSRRRLLAFRAAQLKQGDTEHSRTCFGEPFFEFLQPAKVFQPGTQQAQVTGEEVIVFRHVALDLFHGAAWEAADLFHGAKLAISKGLLPMLSLDERLQIPKTFGIHSVVRMGFPIWMWSYCSALRRRVHTDQTFHSVLRRLHTDQNPDELILRVATLVHDDKTNLPGAGELEVDVILRKNGSASLRVFRSIFMHDLKF